MGRRRSLGSAIPLGFLIFLGIMIAFLFWDTPMERLREYLTGHPLRGAAALIAMLAISTIIAPLSLFPMIPVAAPILGPFPTALYSIVGWTLGAIGAFFIARYIGRPVLERYVSMEEIEKYEKYLPAQATFWYLILLRMAVPVDILSYALGLFSNVSFSMYVWTTVLGVSFFSFVFAYAGNSFFEGHYFFLMLIAVIGILVFFTAGIIMGYTKRK